MTAKSIGRALNSHTKLRKIHGVHKTKRKHEIRPIFNLKARFHASNIQKRRIKSKVTPISIPLEALMGIQVFNARNIAPVVPNMPVGPRNILSYRRTRSSRKLTQCASGITNRPFRNSTASKMRVSLERSIEWQRRKSALEKLAKLEAIIGKTLKYRKDRLRMRETTRKGNIHKRRIHTLKPTLMRVGSRVSKEYCSLRNILSLKELYPPLATPKHRLNKPTASSTKSRASVGNYSCHSKLIVPSDKTLPKRPNSGRRKPSSNSIRSAESSITKKQSNPISIRGLIRSDTHVDSKTRQIRRPESIPGNIRNYRAHASSIRAMKLDASKSFQAPKRSARNRKKSAKRTVIIDGTNVALGHDANNTFSVEALQECLQYFEGLGHDVKAVVPQFRMKRNETSNQYLFQTLKNQGRIILSPAKKMGDGSSASSQDQRFLMQIAKEFDAAIVSNQKYQEHHLTKNYKSIIESRVIGYKFTKGGLVLNKEPYGKGGPKLNEILVKKY